MNSGSTTRPGIERIYPNTDTRRVERVTFIRADGETHAVEAGVARAHDSGNAVVLALHAPDSDRLLPEWVLPAEISSSPSKVEDVVAATSGNVRASFSVHQCDTTNGKGPYVLLKYEGW